MHKPFTPAKVLFRDVDGSWGACDAAGPLRARATRVPVMVRNPCMVRDLHYFEHTTAERTSAHRRMNPSVTTRRGGRRSSWFDLMATID